APRGRSRGRPGGPAANPGPAHPGPRPRCSNPFAEHFAPFALSALGSVSDLSVDTPPWEDFSPSFCNRLLCHRAGIGSGRGDITLPVKGLGSRKGGVFPLRIPAGPFL